MYLKIKGFSYIGLPTTNNITLYKDTTIGGVLTTGNTTINGDLTITYNLIYNGGSSSDSYTKVEIDDKLFLKVNQSYGEMLGKLRINGGLEASVENPLYVNNSTTHTNYWTLATFHQLIANSGSWIQFSREGITDTWQTGIDSDNSYVTRASDATNVVTVNQNGNTTISEKLDVGKVLTLKRIPGVSDTTPLVIINDSPGGATVATYTSPASNQGCVSFWTTAASSTPWVTGVMWGGLNEFVIWRNNIGLTIKPTGDTTISGHLDVGQDQAQTSIKAYVNHIGYTGNVQIEARWRSQGFIHFNTDYPEGLLLFAAKDDLYMYVGIEIV